MSAFASFSLARRGLEADRRLARSRQLRDRILCAEHGLSVTQWHALGELWETEALPMNELAERLRVGRSTATRVVDLLEKKNLAKRKPSRKDRRQIEVGLTPAGEELYHILQAEILQSHREVLGQLTGRDAETGGAAFESMAKALDRWIERRGLRPGDPRNQDPISLG